jgi:hypothetical protein
MSTISLNYPLRPDLFSIPHHCLWFSSRASKPSFLKAQALMPRRSSWTALVPRIVYPTSGSPLACGSALVESGAWCSNRSHSLQRLYLHPAASHIHSPFSDYPQVPFDPHLNSHAAVCSNHQEDLPALCLSVAPSTCFTPKKESNPSCFFPLSSSLLPRMVYSSPVDQKEPSCPTPRAGT